MRFPRSMARPRRLGGSGTSVAGGRISALDTNAAISGDKWYGKNGRDGISAMILRDPHAKQSVGYVTNPLVTARWRFKPASRSPRDIEVADWCSMCLFERLPWMMLLELLVGNYTVDGFALAEMTDDILPFPVDRFPTHPNRQAGVGLIPTALHEIPANTVSRWHPRQDSPTQLASIEQWQPTSEAESSGWRTVPADRIVRFTTGQHGGNFAGIPILRSVYGTWKLKNALLKYEGIGYERTAVGNPVATPSEDLGEYDKQEAEAIELLLENMRTMEKGAIVLPPGWKLEWSGAGENDVQNINIAVERCNTDYAVNVSAGFSRLGLTGPGSYALGTTQVGQYHLSTVRHAALVSTVFTLGLDGWSVVQRIVEGNYGVGTPLPTLEARNLPTRDIKTSLDLLYRGVQARVITPDDPLEDEARDMLDVGPRDPDTARKGVNAPKPPMMVEPEQEPPESDLEQDPEEEQPYDE